MHHVLIPAGSPADCAWLSQSHRTLEPRQRLPHIAAATSPAKSSLNEMWWARGRPLQLEPARPRPRSTAPGTGGIRSHNERRLNGAGERGYPIPVAGKRLPSLSLIWWCGLVALGVRSKSMIRLRNARPGFTTRQACWRVPINDSSSRHRHEFLDDHWSRRSLSRDSLSAGRRMSIELNAEEGQAV